MILFSLSDGNFCYELFFTLPVTRKCKSYKGIRRVKNGYQATSAENLHLERRPLNMEYEPAKSAPAVYIRFWKRTRTGRHNPLSVLPRPLLMTPFPSSLLANNHKLTIIH